MNLLEEAPYTSKKGSSCMVDTRAFLEWAQDQDVDLLPKTSRHAFNRTLKMKPPLMDLKYIDYWICQQFERPDVFMILYGDVVG